ncbi:MAG TPA: cell envelope integrity protein TolA [Saprospiraceae bacterium]|nr:cell envelope integrity protein TolA [Saprospiraceae bacterium]
MRDLDWSYNGEKNKQKGMITSAIIHSLLFLLFFINFFEFEWPPKNDGGILVALGLPDEGMGDDKPDTQDKVPVEEASKPNPTENSKKESTSPDKDVKNTNVKTDPVKIKESTTIDEKSDVTTATDKKKTPIETDAQIADKRRREAELKAQEEAKRKADEEAKKQAEIDAKKKQFGTLLGGGQGNTNTSGNQGDPKGDPNSKALESLAKGSGRIGGGLSNRGVTYEPKFSDKSQKTGRVVIEICVDPSGRVSDAKFTQRGSTTTDSELVAIALKGAREYKFSTGDADSQCGTVTVDFKVQ